MAFECPVCDGHAQGKRGIREITVEGRTVSAEHEFLFCGSCNEEFYTPEMMAATLRRAADVIRRTENSVSAADIYTLRSNLGYSQSEFETILGTGPKTVTRWERGTIVPSGAASTLLRVLMEQPDIAHRIARQRGIRAEPNSRLFGTVVFLNHARPSPRLAEARDVYAFGNSLSALLQDLEEDATVEAAPSLPFEGPSWYMKRHGREVAH